MKSHKCEFKFLMFWISRQTSTAAAQHEARFSLPMSLVFLGPKDLVDMVNIFYQRPQ